MPICRLNLLILLPLLLAACSPVPAATIAPTTAPILPSATPPPSQTPTTTASPTLPPTATPTPEPSPTPRPHYDLHDMSTWPEEMQNYWTGGIETWTDPALTAEFDAFVQQSRRDFLAQNGVENAASLSDLEAFYQYLRIGIEQKAITQFSITELRTMNQDAFNAYTAHIAYYEETQPRIVHDGISVMHSEGMRTQSEYDQWFGDPNSSLRDVHLSVTSVRNVFGSDQAGIVNRYDGIIGDAAAVFRLPGIEPEQAVGILVHTNLGSDHNWTPLVVHFQDLVLEPGSLLVNGMHEIVESTSRIIIPASRSSWDRRDTASILTLSQLMQYLGQKTHCGIDYGDGVYGYFPYGLGLQGANSEIRVLNMDNAPGTYSGVPDWPWNP